MSLPTHRILGVVFECSRRGVSSRTMPLVDAEVIQNTEICQRKKVGLGVGVMAWPPTDLKHVISTAYFFSLTFF